MHLHTDASMSAGSAYGTRYTPVSTEPSSKSDSIFNDSTFTGNSLRSHTCSAQRALNISTWAPSKPGLLAACDLHEGLTKEEADVIEYNSCAAHQHKLSNWVTIL